MASLDYVEILSGNFSEKGNFSAYDEDGERYFIPKRLMESKGWAADADVQFPFWAKFKTKQIGQLDANGDVLMDSNGVPVVVDRLQIASIFTDEQELIDRAVNKQTLKIKIEQAVRAKATAAGLSEKSIDLLTSASF